MSTSIFFSIRTRPDTNFCIQISKENKFGAHSVAYKGEKMVKGQGKNVAAHLKDNG